jgi:hypothetical protein
MLFFNKKTQMNFQNISNTSFLFIQETGAIVREFSLGRVDEDLKPILVIYGLK